MIADAMRYPQEINVGDRIASWHTPQNVQTVSEVRTCDGRTCRACFAPTIHVMTDQGEVRFSTSGFTNDLPWSKICK